MDRKLLIEFCLELTEKEVEALRIEWQIDISPIVTANGVDLSPIYRKLLAKLPDTSTVHSNTSL